MIFSIRWLHLPEYRMCKLIEKTLRFEIIFENGHITLNLSYPAVKMNHIWNLAKKKYEKRY